MILTSVALALLWVVLNDDYSPQSFVVGCAVGYIVALFLYRKRNLESLSHSSLSPQKLLYSMTYILRLLWEMLKAGVTVARIVFDWRMPIKPGIVAVPAAVKGDVEVTLLANSITLTPGTWTLDVPADQSMLYVHALDLQDPEQTKAEVKQRLEKFILRASRC